jgi:hypothetical protein
MVDYNKTAFALPGFKIIAHQKPSHQQTWAPHGQHGYSLGPEMHHYRCQNVYISSTASERIVDTLEFFPHNSPMPQLSSTDRLLVADNYMYDALKHPHPDVPFAQVGDDTMGHAASPRVLARTQNISPRNLSQDDFWNMETANQAIALGAKR